MSEKIIRVIREGRLVEVSRNYMAGILVTDKYRVVKNMNLAPNNRKIKFSTMDFVRTGTLELMAYEINEKQLEGCVAELGVYRGDFAKYINRVFPDRKLYLFDTFEGFSEKDKEIDVKEGYSTGKQDFSDTNIDMVLRKMKNRENCVIRKGWFPETAKGLENEKFVFVSLDTDLYEPIYKGLQFFYPRLQRGGIIFVHDFNNCEYGGASAAVRKFSDEYGIPYLCLTDTCGSAVLLK